MLITIKAEIDVNGNVRLLESIKLSKKSRTIVTVLDEKSEKPENLKRLLEFLQNNRLSDSTRPNVEEIKVQIEDLSNSWE